MNRGFKVIATLRALRGIIALAIAATLIYLSQGDVNAAADLLSGFVTVASDPALELATHWLGSISKNQILSLALLAFLLGSIRWIEAIGLWFNKQFAKWMTLVSLLIYIPFEIHELMGKVTLGITIILIVNLVVVGYLSQKLYLNSRLQAKPI